jgi:hypothetical protein
MVLAHRIGFFQVLNLQRKKAIVDIFLAPFQTLGSARHPLVPFTKCYDMDIYEVV